MALAYTIIRILEASKRRPTPPTLGRTTRQSFLCTHASAQAVELPLGLTITQSRVKRRSRCIVATMVATQNISACLRIVSLAALCIQQPKAGPSVRLPKEPCMTATKSLAGISGWCLSPLSIFALWSCGRQNLRECFFLII